MSSSPVLNAALQVGGWTPAIGLTRRTEGLRASFTVREPREPYCAKKSHSRARLFRGVVIQSTASGQSHLIIAVSHPPQIKYGVVRPTPSWASPAILGQMRLPCLDKYQPSQPRLWRGFRLKALAKAQT